MAGEAATSIENGMRVGKVNTSEVRMELCFGDDTQYISIDRPFHTGEGSHGINVLPRPGGRVELQAVVGNGLCVFDLSQEQVKQLAEFLTDAANLVIT